MEKLQTAVEFAKTNIAYILIGIVASYLAVFAIRVKMLRVSGVKLPFRTITLFAMIAILCVSVYCLSTGVNVNSFFNQR